MARFKDMKTLHKFVSVHASIYTHFNHQRHLTQRDTLQTSPSRCPGRMASTCYLRALYYGFFCSGPVRLTMPGSGYGPF